MKINDLKNSFDAISPTAEQKDRMLKKILKVENKAVTKAFHFRRLLVTTVGLAAVIAISVVAFNYGDFDINEETNMIAHKTEDAVQKKTIKEESTLKKSEKTEKKFSSKKSIQVASAEPVIENKTESADIPMPMARTIEAPENITTEEANENSGIAVASETEEHNHGISVVSEIDTSNDLEWMKMPSLEETEKLEEENVKTEEEKEEEKEEETEEVAE